MKRTKDDIIAGVRRQNEYVLRHNKELREEVELLRKGVWQVKESLHAVLLAMAKKCGSTLADGRVVLRIPHPDVADAKQYAQHIEKGDDGDTVITFTKIPDKKQKKQKSDG